MREETNTVNYDLIDKYVETEDYKYMEEWLESENAYNLAIRISLQTGKEPVVTQFYPEYYQVDGQYIRADYVNELYIKIVSLSKTWNHKYSRYSTYMTNYAPRGVLAEAREINNGKRVGMELEDGSPNPFIEGLMATDDMPLEYLQQDYDFLVKYVEETHGEKGRDVFLTLNGEKTLTAVGKIWGVSVQSVSYLRNQIVNQLKEEVYEQLNYTQ